MWVSRKNYQDLVATVELLEAKTKRLEVCVSHLSGQLYEERWDSLWETDRTVSLNLKGKVQAIMDHLGLKEKHLPAKPAKTVFVVDHNKT